MEEVRRRVGGGKEGKGPGKSEGFGEEKGGGGKMSGREKVRVGRNEKEEGVVRGVREG